MPTSEDRAQRKNTDSYGMIYLGFEEHRIKVLNLSLSGLLAELQFEDCVPDTKDIFRALQVSPLVDIYLPDLRMAGEAEVVRADVTVEGMQIAVEFRNLSYDADNLLYNRRAYRKNMTAPGLITLNHCEYTFNTENVSVDGLMLRILGKLQVETGTTTLFYFKHLELEGEAKVVWVEHDADTTLLGLQYQYLASQLLSGRLNIAATRSASD